MIHSRIGWPNVGIFGFQPLENSKPQRYTSNRITMGFLKSKLAKGILITILFIGAFRLCLPHAVKWFLNNKALKTMESYQGSVQDVEISFLKGAYAIDSLKIVKIEGEHKEPFVSIKRIDLGLEWKYLFKGKIVAEIICQQPIIHFDYSDVPETAQTGTEQDWPAMVREFFPVEINTFAMRNGAIYLTNLMTDPKTDFALDYFEFEINNLQNVITDTTETLPTNILFQASSREYGAKIDFKAKANLLKEIPDFDYNFSVENIELTAFNKQVEHYTDMTLETGKLSLFSEMAMKDKHFKGYLKPLVKDMRIFLPKEEGRTIGEWFKELFSEGAQEILENQDFQQFATKIPVEGDLENPESSVWTIIGNTLYNAYVDALKHQFDRTIDLEDAEKQKKE